MKSEAVLIVVVMITVMGGVMRKSVERMVIIGIAVRVRIVTMSQVMLNAVAIVAVMRVSRGVLEAMLVPVGIRRLVMAPLVACVVARGIAKIMVLRAVI